MESTTTHPILNHYKFIKNLNPIIVKKIKRFYIFGVTGTEIIAVTFDDEVYTYGINDYKWLGTGVSGRTNQFTKISELCNKNVIKIDCGLTHVALLTKYGRVYTIGENSCGQLGDGSTRPNDTKLPILNKIKNITDISCGGRHTLAVTCVGDVYSFGGNDYGQIGNGCFYNQLSPYKLEGFDSKVEQISSGLEHSLALTVKGTVYSWGNNECNQIGLYSTERENIPTIVKYFSDFSIHINQICCGRECSLLLSNLCKLYVFDKTIFVAENKTIPVMLENIIEIATSIHAKLMVSMTSDKMMWYWGECGDNCFNEPILLKTMETTIDESFINLLDSKITYKTVNTSMEESSSCLIQYKYKREFNEICERNYGAFAQLVEAYHRTDKKSYIIKKIETFEFNFEKKYQEVSLLRQLQSDYVVKYYDSWLELDDEYEERYIFYIQLESAKLTLTHVIYELKEKLSEFESLSPIGYYIASELFIECVEGVDYLHKQNPAIIHRNLTTNNFLVTNGNNSRFVKLCSFGFSTKHNDSEHSHSQHIGTIGYMAPEVSSSSKYDTSADIYSLGIIMQKLFSLDINDKNPQFHKFLSSKYTIVRELLLTMLSPKNIERPNTEHILQSKNEWSLSFDVLNDNIDLNEYESIPLNTDSAVCFANFFIEQKLKHFSSAEHSKLTRKISNMSFSENKSKTNINAKPVDEYDINFDNILKNYKYQKEFNEIKQVGSGGFGSVFETIKYSNGQSYAVKKLPVDNNPNAIKLVSRELSLLSRLKSEFVVEYIDHWTETNYYLTESKDRRSISSENMKMFDKNRVYLLHIQMELCSTTLSAIIEDIKQNLFDKNTNTLFPIGYFVASVLLIEILECVKFLHNQNPPIIHRDLKPSNILLTDGSNGRFVKLADFGLAKAHNYEGNTLGTGTRNYMAPEVFCSKSYDVKADMYSMGIIVENLFYLSLTDSSIVYENDLLNQKYGFLQNSVQLLLAPVASLRLDSDELLNSKQFWAISVNEIKNVYNFDKFYANSLNSNICTLLKKIIALKLNRKFD